MFLSLLLSCDNLDSKSTIGFIFIFLTGSGAFCDAGNLLDVNLENLGCLLESELAHGLDFTGVIGLALKELVETVEMLGDLEYRLLDLLRVL